MPNNSAAHTKLVNETVLALSKRKDLGDFWKNATGVARAMHNEKYLIRYGLEGSSDVIGILSNGLFAGIEMKTGSGKLSKAQEGFKKMIINRGGLYIVCVDTDGAVLAIETFLDYSCKK
jgi:hypothetical protein